ncbi:hypothetical protein PQX77_019196, partial [Marasmius sp. AFHP31]
MGLPLDLLQGAYGLASHAQDSSGPKVPTSQQRTAESTNHLDNPDIFKTVDEAINWDPYSYFPNGQGKVFHVWDNEE